MSLRDYSRQDLADTLPVYLARTSAESRVIYFLLLVLVAAGLLSLPLVRVDVSFGAAGVLRPEVERIDARAAVSGVVAEVRVRRGDAVARGAVLAVIDDAAAAGRSATADRRLRDARSLITDLEALIADSWSATPGTVELGNELVQLATEAAEHDLEIDRLDEEAGRARALAARGLLPIQEAEAHEHRLRRAVAARESLLARYRGRWAAQLAELRREIGEHSADAERIADELARHVILAPASGTVEELRPLAPGSVVQAGEVIAVISPDTGQVAESYVSARDVGLVRVGMQARLHVDAFNYLDWGYLRAEVVEISGDYVLIDDVPAFRVLLAIRPDTLRLRNGATARLRKGMTISTRFPLAERTLLQLLRDDLSDWAHPWATSTRGGGSAE